MVGRERTSQRQFGRGTDGVVAAFAGSRFCKIFIFHVHGYVLARQVPIPDREHVQRYSLVIITPVVRKHYAWLVPSGRKAHQVITRILQAVVTVEIQGMMDSTTQIGLGIYIYIMYQCDDG